MKIILIQNSNYEHCTGSHGIFKIKGKPAIVAIGGYVLSTRIPESKEEMEYFNKIEENLKEMLKN